MPSTWPCTTCPPRRSSARSASSRLTRAPASSCRSEERSSVSFIACARKLSASDVDRGQAHAVDGDRVALAAARARARVAIWSVAPVAVVLERRDAAEVGDQAGEHAPPPIMWRAHHSRSRAEISRSSPDALAVERERAQRLGDLLDAFALERVARGAPAEQQRREEQPEFVDLAGVEERAREVRAALEQDRRDAERRRAGRAPSARARARFRRSPRAPARRRLRARRCPRARPPRDDDRQRDLRRGGHQLRAGRQARERVEDDPPGLGARLRRQPVGARGQLRVVGQRGADADHDRVDRRAPAVRQLAAVLAADPLRVAACAWRPCRRASSRT